MSFFLSIMSTAYTDISASVLGYPVKVNGAVSNAIPI